MKKTVISLFCILFATLATGQDYHSFPTSNAIWNNHIYALSGPLMHLSSITRLGTYGDTVINDKLYNKLFLIENDSTLNLNKMTYYAAIRENNNKQVFVKLIENDFEVLIYDFGLNIGDTIFSNTTTGYLATNTRVIKDIDSVKINDNTYRKRFKIFSSEYWIEGIGSISSLLAPITDFSYLPSNYIPLLICLKQYNTAMYLYYQTNLCFLQQATAIEDYQNQNKEITIYPNPTSNIIFIKSDLPPGMTIVSLFNSIGELLRNETYNSFPIELNLDILQPGIYLIHVNNGNFTYSEKIIKN